MIPALGYLIQYERLLKKSAAGKLTTAELTYLVEKFDPAELYDYEQARELSIELLKDWLVRYKFKNWTYSKTLDKEVTPELRAKRAREIAKCLSNTQRWHSHRRGISMAVLRKDADLRLEIEDFGDNKDENRALRGYYLLLKDYMLRRGHRGIIHTPGYYRPLS